MPSMANLSLQNNAAAAVTGTAISPSAGDSVDAIWRIENTNPPMTRTTITMKARPNRDRTVRTVEVKIVAPRTYTDGNTGLVMTDSRATFVGSFVVPQGIDSSRIDDTVAYIKTFFADATVIACLKSQTAPT